MKLVHDILGATRAAKNAAIKSWARVCTAFFDAVEASYPDLVEANIRRVGAATLDLLEHGATDDASIRSGQYPPLQGSQLEEPALRALYEVGALRIDPAGNPVVEPSPAALLRGLARLALPTKYLAGIVNAARKWRGEAPLTASEFRDLDDELFLALKSGLRRSLGEQWFRILNRASYLAGRAYILPCIPLRGSQEFYEEGIAFYRRQGSDVAVYIYSTTSGLIIPREFHGDASKNHYRYRYFTEGILGRTVADRIYQWERYRTAKELAKGYVQMSDASGKDLYREQAIETLGRFADSSNLAILEADRFDPWKEWHTLVGPRRQQISIRPEDLKGKIGHGIVYDADAFRMRADLTRDAGIAIAAAGAVGAAYDFELFKTYGPAVGVAAAACALLSTGLDRLARLIREPLISRCTRDSTKVREVKGLGKTLSRRKVESIVDDLLAAGQRILSLEKDEKNE